MPLYLYCVIPAGGEPPPPNASGIDGRPVRALASGSLAAWVSDVPDRGPAPSVARARTHDAVVRAALASVTPVPARFGQVLGSDDALTTWLDARAPALLDALALVRGCVEITIRILFDDARASSPALAPRESGAAYLRWLRARDQARQWTVDRAEFLRDRLARVVEDAGLVRDTAWRWPAPDARALELAHLVPRDVVARHRIVVREAVQVETGCRLMMSGPWAPYTFCPALHD